MTTRLPSIYLWNTCCRFCLVRRHKPRRPQLWSRVSRQVSRESRWMNRIGRRYRMSQSNTSVGIENGSNTNAKNVRDTSRRGYIQEEKDDNERTTTPQRRLSNTRDNNDNKSCKDLSMEYLLSFMSGVSPQAKAATVMEARTYASFPRL
jgi:hypothetical protein